MGDIFDKVGGAKPAKPPQGDVFDKVAQPDIDNTGIVGPDQTAPPQPEGFLHSAASVLGLAPEQMAAANQEAGAHPFKTIANALDTTAPLKAMVQSAITHGPEMVKKAYGEATAANTALGNRDIPGYLAHEIGGMGYTGAALASPVLGNAPAKAGEQFGEGNNAGGLGTTAGILAPMIVAGALKPKTPPLARVTTPTQESAFNVLHPENAVAPKSILGEVRNAAAQQGVTKVPKGRAGVELPQRVIQGSIDNHEAQVQAIKNPYRGAAVDNSTASDAALSKITPEMRASAARGDAGVQRAISQIEDVAARARSANTIDTVDQLRHSWNDELSSELSKSAASQDVSPAATQAKRAAASALRSNMYDRLADLSGRDDVRALAQREGALIEAKAGVTKTATNALKSKRNDLGSSPRIQAVANAAKKINLAKPASTLSFLPDAIRAVIDPASQTPVGQYQARVMRSLGKLGPAEPNAPLYTPPTPVGLLNAAPIELGPSGIQNPSSPTPPIASTTRTQRLGVTPPSASGTVEHVPYNSQANASTLPNAIRVPKQIGAGPDIRGLLPTQVESAIGLPEHSQSTLTNGRTIESPASNPGVVPGLVRDYVNGRQNTSGVSGHNSINGGSLEEIQRGNTIKVNPKTGTFGSHGGSIDVGSGEAVLRQRADGTLEVANNNSGVADSEILKRFAPNAARVYGKPGRAPNTIELIHRGGEHGDVPVHRVADYLGSGEYRLAPRR